MAGMFYSLQEAADKLNMPEQQVRELVKQGKLREFRDGANVLFKVDEVEALTSDVGAAAPEEAPPPPRQSADTGEISLAAESTGGSTVGDELMDADTIVAGQGVNVLGETDSESPPAGDTMAETKGTADEPSLEEIEEDVNLDTFGSGSGLLDLSLQADDTSLGGILDEIYTAEDGQETTGGSALAIGAEAEPVLPEELATPEPAPGLPVMAQVYAEPAPDTLSNAFGIMLLLPLLAIVYTAVVAVAAFREVMPSILGRLQAINGPYGIHIIWFVVVGAAVATGLIAGVALMLAGGGAKAGKKKKVKEKVKKPKKAKKTKKAKAKKGADSTE